MGSVGSCSASRRRGRLANTGSGVIVTTGVSRASSGSVTSTSWPLCRALAYRVAAVRAKATFEVASFVPADVGAEPPVATALPVGVASMVKIFRGQAAGRSTVVFTSAFDQSAGTGTYVALESFEGSLDGRRGTFNFVHSASTGGSDRTNEFFLIVPASGTGDLTGITGSGGLSIDADGTHRIWFDYDVLPVA